MREEDILDINNEKEESFLTWKRFYSAEEAENTASVLGENKIICLLEDNTPPVSDFIMGQNTKANIALKIKATDFIKADKLFNEIAKAQVDSADESHYLFQYSNDELLEVLMEADSWSEYDKQLSKKILEERGIIITDELLKTFAAKRLKELAKKEHHSPVWTIVGYVSALFGGFLGIAIGINLWTAKKTLPNGMRVYAYTDRDRFHGQIITAISALIFIYTIFSVVSGKLFFN